MKTVKEILIEASNLLSEDTWYQGSFFNTRWQEDTECTVLCYCAHGAVQAVGNEKVAEILSSPICIEIAVTSDAQDVAGDTRARDAWRLGAQNTLFGLSVQDNWNSRPFFCNDPTMAAHYVLGMVGLTSVFNDLGSTTFQMIKQKFTLAIETAKRLDI